jgi:hypothetical protein
MKSIIIKGDTDAFDAITEEFLKVKDPELIQEFLNLGMKVVKSVRNFYPDLVLDETFDKDIILDFTDRIIREKDLVSPSRSLRNIAYNRIQVLIEEADTPRIETLDAQVYEMDASSRLIFEESLQEVLKGLPLRIQAAILYLVYFPEKSNQLYSICPSILDFFLILRGIERLKNMVDISEGSESYFQFKLPETQISRLLLVSSMYKLSPASLVLFMQMKSFPNLLQFCSLFGGEQVSIPTVGELQEAIQNSSELANRLEEGKITVGDQEALAFLASDLNGVENYDLDIPLNPVLSAFFEKILDITLKNYDNYQKRLISSVNVESTTDIMRIYEVMNKELRAQIQLVMEISGSLEGQEEVRRVIDILTKTYNED